MRNITSKLFRSFVGALSLALVLVLAGANQPTSATALIVDSDTVTVFALNDTFGVDFNCSGTGCGGEGVDPLETMTAMIFWTVTAFDADADSVSFNIEIMNTTTTVLSTARITQFGVEILDPDTMTAPVVDLTLSTNTWGASLDTNFPTFGQVDLFVDDLATPVQGVGEGATDELDLQLLDLNLTSSLNSTDGLTLNIFPIKFQSVGDVVCPNQDPANNPQKLCDSFEFAGTLKDVPGTEVPEPSTFAIFVFGLIGLGFFARRRLAVA